MGGLRRAWTNGKARMRQRILKRGYHPPGGGRRIERGVVSCPSFFLYPFLAIVLPFVRFFREQAKWQCEERNNGWLIKWAETTKSNIDNRYAALSSTEEDADFESQEYGSAGYGVGIIGVGELALRRLKKCGNLDEGFGRIILLEQGSGINHSPGDAPAGFSNIMRQDRQYADADAAGSDGWKKNLPPRLTYFTFSVPSPLTEITKMPIRGMAKTRTRTIAAAATVEAAREAATSLLDLPTISYNNRCIVGDGNKAVVLSPPSFNSAFASHSPHFLVRGEESAEPKLSSSSLAGEEDLSRRRYLLNKAGNPSQTSSASSMAMLSSRPATVPSPPAQEVSLRPCIPLSSKPISILATGHPVSITTPRPCYNPLPLPKFIPSAAARKVATQGRRIPVCLHGRSIDTTSSPLLSIDDPAKAREKRKGEEMVSGGGYELSSSTLRRKDARAVRKKKMVMKERRGSWLVEELLRMWKESGDDSSPLPFPPSTVTAPTTLVRSERKRPELLKKSRGFSTITVGGCDYDGWEDDAKVVDAGWLEYVIISAPIDFGQGQGGMSKGNEKVEVPIITSAVVGLARFEDEDEGPTRVGGNDILEDGDGNEKEKEEEEEGEGLLVELFENIVGGQEGGGGLGDDLELVASEMEMGESWGWDVISRVEAYD